jgi:GrpB-like predicted nucleotidyltransferase (UPF0157 family)
MSDTNTIVVVDYDPTWPVRFEQEKAQILAVAGEYIEDIQHVGSTSVPGLAAKPIIDILVAIRDLALVEKTVEPLQSLGYGYFGEFGIPERHFFPKPPPSGWSHRTHHIHMVLKNSNQWENQLRFRDYLRTHADARQEYAALKRTLALEFADNREGYTDAKQDFVFATLRKAGYRDIRDTTI